MQAEKQPQQANTDQKAERKDSIVSEDKEEQNDKKLEERKKQDAKSIFIENVDYKTTKEQLELIFQDCGTISRVTIVKDPYTRQPKGIAYLSFQDERGVEVALNLSGTKHRGRIIKVQRKRTNIMGMTKATKGERNIHFLNEMVKQFSQNPFRGRGRGRGK